MPPHVFIAASSRDYELAQQVYELIIRHGTQAFFSQESLPKLGSSDYGEEIEAALEQAKHMVVVTSSAENVRSEWVKHEWGAFLSEKLSEKQSAAIC